MAKFSELAAGVAGGRLAYLTRQPPLAWPGALFIAVAFGLGTGLWSTASQTLWQHETAIFGLSLAVFGLTGTGVRRCLAIGIGLGLAASSRPQLVARR